MASDFSGGGLGGTSTTPAGEQCPKRGVQKSHKARLGPLPTLDVWLSVCAACVGVCESVNKTQSMFHFGIMVRPLIHVYSETDASSPINSVKTPRLHV